MVQLEWLVGRFKTARPATALSNKPRSGMVPLEWLVGRLKTARPATT